MRYQGRITEWKDDRGFGFITQNGSGNKAFVHISAFTDRRKRPASGDMVTYTCVEGRKRGYQAVDVQYAQAAGQVSRVSQRAYTHKKRHGIVVPLLTLMLVGGAGLYAWKTPVPKLAVESYLINQAADEQFAAIPKPTPIQLSFQCQGKQYCSEMTSCAEATYYQHNCPDTKMDGDHDGIPCESQWCY